METIILFCPGTQHVHLVLKLQRTDVSKDVFEQESYRSIFKHSLIVRISNLLRLVPQNRDGTSFPTPRLDEWEAPLGLECLEALREGTHMGHLTGHSNISGGSMVIYLLGNNWSGPGADEEEYSTVGGEG